MKKIGVLLMISFLFLKGYSQEKNFIDQSYLETTAAIDTLVVPDRIYLSIFISEKDTKDKISVEALENKMNVQLKTLGIDTKEQLFLSDVASNFKRYFFKKTDVLKQKSYTLLVYDALTAGKVMVRLESIGISNVDLYKVEYSKIENLKIKLRERVVAKAKIQAESLLKPLGQKLIKALYISDINTPVYYKGKTSRLYVSESKVKGDSYTPIDIAFEKIKVSSTVTIKFAIE